MKQESNTRMTDADWQRIHRDTERAIEVFKKALTIAEVGKKKERQAQTKNQ